MSEINKKILMKFYPKYYTYEQAKKFLDNGKVTQEEFNEVIEYVQNNNK